MDYADLREAIYDALCAEVPAVGDRVFWGWTAPADTQKPFLEISFLGELPSDNPCGTWMQLEVLVIGEESNILALDPIADTVGHALHNMRIPTPDGRAIRPEQTRDARIDGWSESLRANIIRLKFLIPTDVWRP